MGSHEVQGWTKRVRGYLLSPSTVGLKTVIDKTYTARVLLTSIIATMTLNLLGCGGDSAGNNSAPSFAPAAPITRLDLTNAQAVFLVTVPFTADPDDVNVDENGAPLTTDDSETNDSDADDSQTADSSNTTDNTETDSTTAPAENELPSNVKIVAATVPGVPRFTSKLFKIDTNNQLSEVIFYDSNNSPKSFSNNLNINAIYDNLNEGPIDLLDISDQYLLVAYIEPGERVDDPPTAYNLLVDKTTGAVISAPTGITDTTNSGKFPYRAESGDYFPPNSQFNGTEDIYIIAKDYGLEPEQPTIQETEPDPSAEATPSTTSIAAALGFSRLTSSNQNDAETSENSEASTDNSSEENSDSDNISELSATNPTVEEEIPPEPTAVYRLEPQTDGTINLIRISGEEDRPGPGTFVVDKDGNAIYRNLAGGDYSYRVRTKDGFTSRLLLKTTTLTIGPDGLIYEITNNGVNRIIIKEDGRALREAYVAYPRSMTGLELTKNYTSTPIYRQIQGLIINNNCDKLSIWQRIYTARAEIENPVSTYSLFQQEFRERKSVISANNFYCFAYDEALEFSVYEGTLDETVETTKLALDFTNYQVDFRSLWVFNDNLIYFNATDLTTDEPVVLFKDLTDTETVLTEAEQGLIIRQYVQLVEPTPTVTP